MFKKLSALILALLMVIGVVGCRSTTGDFSSGSSTVLEYIEESDVMVPTESTDDTAQKPNTPGKKPTASSKPSASTPSGNNNSSTNTPTASAPTDYSALIPKYSNHEFEISGFWSPYSLDEASLKLFKDGGFNTMMLGNNNIPWTKNDQYYLGSAATLEALKNCKKAGLNVILSYNSWVAERIEGSSSYYGDTPFSKHDVYGDYKDIITGIHIWDEPKKSHFAEFATDTIINDFKKVYPNAHYVVNMVPEYAGATAYEFDTYEGMWEYYGQNVASKFENNRFASLDFYFFYKRDNGVRKNGILRNYNTYANFAKKYNTSQTFIMQSSVSPVEHNGLGEYEGNEFVTELYEGDMRLQANMALAFGADALQYYCYAVPKVGDVHMYQNCILNRDNTPSDLYYYVQKVNNEVQSYADVILSYDWDKTTAVAGMMMGVNVSEIYEFQDISLSDSKYYVSANCTTDLVVSRFKGDKGEAYMFVNFADRENKNKADIQMKGCRAVAIYGEAGFNGTPRIVELKDGEFTLNLDYGEGAFVVPLA